jgi:uncharacterized glyoxalase superfamily protein PhnB
MAAKKKAKKAAKAARRAAKVPKRKAAKKATPPRKRALKNRRQPETLRLRSAGPSFTVNDIQRSLAFYRDVLGLHVKERWMHEGQLRGAEMVAGNVTFYLGQDDWQKGRDRVKGVGFRIYCTTVQDIDALAARIKAAGGTLLEEIADRSWGSRDFAVADPDGFKITISTPME